MNLSHPATQSDLKRIRFTLKCTLQSSGVCSVAEDERSALGLRECSCVDTSVYGVMLTVVLYCSATITVTVSA